MKKLKLKRQKSTSGLKKGIIIFFGILGIISLGLRFFTNQLERENQKWVEENSVEINKITGKIETRTQEEWDSINDLNVQQMKEQIMESYKRDVWEQTLSKIMKKQVIDNSIPRRKFEPNIDSLLENELGRFQDYLRDSINKN